MGGEGGGGFLVRREEGKVAGPQRERHTQRERGGRRGAGRCLDEVLVYGVLYLGIWKVGAFVRTVQCVRF